VELNFNKVETIKEVGPIDITGLNSLIDNLSEADWDTVEDFNVNYNKNLKRDNKQFKVGALNATKHITFKFANKKNIPIEYINCSKWPHWKSILIPILDEATNYLSYKNRYYPKVMLANLPANKIIPPHIDGNAKGYVPHKLHIPIQTNEGCFFFLESKKHHFKEGIAYEVNNGKKHAVINSGETDRIHLIFECLDFDVQSTNLQFQMKNPVINY
jgi:hypothetical protein